MAQFSDLSVEVYCLIFAWFLPQELLTIRCTCKLWKSICDQIAHARALHDGPFMLHNDEYVPDYCTLPIYKNMCSASITSPAVARSGHGMFRSALMAPFARAKLTSLALYEQTKWTPELLNKHSLPRLKLLYINSPTERSISASASNPWPGIESLALKNNAVRRICPEAFPSCNFLSFEGSTVLPSDVECWSLKRLMVHNGVISSIDVISRIAEVFLFNVAIQPSVHATNVCIDPDGFWPEYNGTDDPGLALVHELPFAETLRLQFITDASHLGLCTPRLKSLSQRRNGPRLLKSVITQLSTITIVGLETTDVAWLASQRLCSIELREVSVLDLDFLADCLHLESLNLIELRMHPKSVPFTRLTKVKTLKINNSFGCITNISDIGNMSNLEVLFLEKVPFIKNISFIGNLPLLRRLRLRQLIELETLDGVQDAASLTWLTVDRLRGLQSVSALSDLKCIEKLKLRWYPSESWNVLFSAVLDLSKTSTKTLIMEHMCGKVPILPARLRNLQIKNCQFQNPGGPDSVYGSNLECLRPLRNLQRLTFEFENYNEPITPGLLNCVASLNTLHFHCKRVLPGAFLKVRAHRVIATFEDEASERESLVEMTRLEPAVLCVTVWWTHDIDVWRLFAPTLRSLTITCSLRDKIEDLTGLSVLTQLQHLELSFWNGTRSLEFLRGHQCLRELIMRGSGTLVADGIAPLLTCPRLAYVEFDQCNVLPEQLLALQAHIESQVL